MMGQSLSHYRIIEKIGAGGMGVVYRARDERLERDVALKVLPAGILSDAAARARFRREALALSSLSHPHIGVVHDFDTQDGTDFLVMEYVSGQTLGARIRSGPIPESEVVAVGIQIAEALEEAHERGIIHRDLKPDNVILTPKGWVKVLDFGLAKLLAPVGATAQTVSLSSADIGGGTLPYMAPEQLLGQPADARADLFALGAVLYEMATGRRPFVETLATALVNEILSRAPAPPRTIRPELSAGLERIILTCLEKDRTRRFQSAQELLRELRGGGAADASARVASAKVAPGAPRERRIESLAVLPLENLSGDADQEYFADGMTEELIASLAQISALRVISRTSVMRYKGARKPLSEIARELNVEAVVEGSVRRAGGRVRITAQLLDAAEDRHLWAKSYERDLRDVLALQGEVAQAIAREIRVKLAPAEHARLIGARSVNPEAYEASLKARYHMNRRTEEGLKSGIEYFQEAIRLDPADPLAYVGLADSYNLLGYYSLLPPSEAFPRAKAAATKALAVAPDLAEAQTSLAYVSLYYDWDWVAAETGFRRAIELNPAYSTAHLWYANVHAVFGRTEECLAEWMRASELDPVSLIAMTAPGWARYYAGQFAEAVEGFREPLEIDPTFLPARLWRGYALEQVGRYAEAIRDFQEAYRIGGLPHLSMSSLARGYALAGDRAKALELLERLAELSKTRYVPSYYIAAVHVALKDFERALDFLDRAYDEHSHWLVFLSVEAKFHPLRQEPRFQDLLRKVGLEPAGQER